MKPSGRSTIYGLMAEFETSHALVEAARRAHHEGYRKMDAYSPVPIEELHDALHMHDNRLPKLVLAGGILGGLGGYSLQYYVSTIAYPLNVGGRPLHSWPMFIPVTFETTILAAALTTVLGMLALNGLPQPFHPVFNVAALRAREPQPVLPVHRGAGSEVQHRTHEAVSGIARRSRGHVVED